MMVNKKAAGSTRGRILEILRNAETPVSGENAAARLGISRVAVWKGIQTLNANGYRIVTTPAGYLMEADREDSIFPWEFGADENRFRHWNTTDSTMNRAREAALSGAREGLVITAESQSAGRGTGTKKWESATGGLLFTLITRPRLNAAYAHRQVLAAQLALADAVNTVTGSTVHPLWPNDFLYNGGKAGGILCETLSSGNSIGYLNLGIGINTGTKPALPGSSAIPAGRKELLAEFLKGFGGTDPSGHGLDAAWNARCPLTGKTVRFLGQSGTIKTGIFAGVDPAGWAVIRNTNDEENREERHYPPDTITILDKGYEA